MSDGTSRLLLFGVLALPAVTMAGAIPNDPDFALQWGLHNTGQEVEGQPGIIGADVQAPAAWDIHRGTSSVVVAIVGRGIDPHPEFSDRLLEGHATVGDPFNTLDTCPHDTHLAGIIAAATNNGEGIAGLNGRAWLLPVRVLDGCAGTASSTAEGIMWAVDHGADIVLVPVQFYEPVPALAGAVAYAVAHRVIIIAPTGYAGNNGVAFPAAFDGCLAVSATTNRDTLSSSSNYGPEVDLAAPGRGIWSTWTDGGYAYQEPGRDTASASAFVAGVAALVRSYAPQLSISDVIGILINSADDLGEPGWDMYFGAGRLNARRALELTPAPALRFEHLEPLPATIPPGTPSSFVIRIASVAQTVLANSAVLLYRSKSLEFTLAPLTSLGDELFRVELPAVPCELTLEYYLAAAGNGDTVVVTDPLDAPGHLHSAYAIHTEFLFGDDFETDQGWEVVTEGPDATTGVWTRVIPVGTSAQPGFDYSPDAGRYCYVTGQHFAGHDGTNDVDFGPVRVLSPVIELTAAEAEVSYARWFYWSGGEEEDFLTVELSRDGGYSWVTVETVAATGAWQEHSFRLSELPQVTGDRLRVRFSTEDGSNDSLTEAAIDEFHVRAIRCSVTLGDANGDGVIDLADFETVIHCWSGPAFPFLDTACEAVDFDGNGRVDLSDYQGFQSAFGTR